MQSITPGPWQVFILADDPLTYGDNAGKPIITAQDHDTEICGVVVNPADAPILAASWELLDVLRDVFARWDKDDIQDAPELSLRIDAVLAKAEGR
jgi:hypothetical protein